MSLTNASQPIRCGAAAVLLCGLFQSAQSEALSSSVITHLAGHGDTLWVATAAGLNFTIDTTDTAPQWWARQSREPWALAFGEARALAALDIAVDTPDTGRSVFTSTFLSHHHQSGQTQTPVLTLTWRHGADTLARGAGCYATLRAGGAWWMAFYEAGLLRWDDAGEAAAFLPGVNGVACRIDSFPHIAFTARLRREDTRVVHAAAGAATDDTLRIWVATHGRIWRFTPADTGWDTLANTLADSLASLIRHHGVFVDAAASPARVYALSSVRYGPADTSTGLYRYYNDAWHYVYGRERDQRESAPVSVSFAAGGYVYIADSTGISLHRDDDSGAVPRIRGKSWFRSRMVASTDLVSWSALRITEVLSAARDDGPPRLWIGTSAGLFLSRFEEPSDSSGTTLLFIKQSRPAAGDLDEVYACPGILRRGSRASRCEVVDGPENSVVFIYRLARRARVTIDIFDFNMDRVRRIIHDAVREGRASDNSTDPNHDFWDGTNENGRMVAPGVYYFRITTSTGGRAFGKVVVAASR